MRFRYVLVPALLGIVVVVSGQRVNTQGLSPQPDPPGSQKFIIPKGTVLEKIAVGQIKLKLRNGMVVEMKGISRSGNPSAIIGDSGVYDKTGKPIAKGKHGRLVSGLRPAGLISPLDFIKIDDEPTWFPMTLVILKEDPEPLPDAKIKK